MASGYLRPGCASLIPAPNTKSPLIYHCDGSGGLFRRRSPVRGRAKVALIRGLYHRGFARERVLDLLQLIDWLLAVPPEVDTDVWRTLEALEEEQKMSYVTSFERIGRAEGMAKGRAEGLLEGILEGKRELVRSMMQRRFGALPEALDQRLATADQAVLDTIADRLLTAATIDDVFPEA